MSVTMTQKRLAADLLKVGVSRVWINPEELEKVETAITRDEIRRLIHEGVIKAVPERGISKGRRRISHRRRGPGKRKGSRISSKDVWITRIRALRRRLKELRDKRLVKQSVYRRLLLLAKGGTFRSVSHLEEYIKAHRLARKGR